MTLRSRFLIFLLFLSGGLLFGEEFRFTGFWDYFGGIEPEEGYENLESRVYMNPSFLGYDDKTGLEWYLSAQLLVRPLGDPESIDPWEILDEAYLFLPAGDFDFSLGLKLTTYGFADIYGPLNVLHSTNRDVLSWDESYDGRRADPLLQVKYYPTFNDILEFTCVPVTRPDKEQSDSVYLEETNDWVIWSDDDWIYDSYPSVVASYTRYGERVDWQFLYGNYIEHTPDFEISSVDTSGASEITCVYNRKQTFGAAYSTALGNTTFSQDIAFSLTENWDGSDLGGQYSDLTVNTQILGNLPWGILSQTSIVYSHFFNYDEYESSSDSYASDYLAEVIQQFHTQSYANIAFVVEHMEKNFLRETMKVQLNAALIYPYVYLGPRLAWSMTDFWAFETGADVLTGDPSDDDLRRNPNNDNFYVRIIYRY
ncbi:MAG: hypothetical protein PQJ60_12455 [Spirochaetales bacterium]|nr:hypothetical protein [Spirochaetales bacterium]